MYKIFAICFIIFLASCSDNDVPINILSAEKMQPILWQQIKAEIYTRENLISDSIKSKNLSLENEKLQMQIFRNNNVTKEEFYKSYNYYLKHEDKFSELLDSIIAKQTRANLVDLQSQYGGNSNQNTKNIFLDSLFKPIPIFTLDPDTLKKENIISTDSSQKINIFNPSKNYNPHKNLSVPNKFNPQ